MSGNFEPTQMWQPCELLFFFIRPKLRFSHLSSMSIYVTHAYFIWNSSSKNRRQWGRAPSWLVLLGGGAPSCLVLHIRRRGSWGPLSCLPPVNDQKGTPREQTDRQTQMKTLPYVVRLYVVGRDLTFGTELNLRFYDQLYLFFFSVLFVHRVWVDRGVLVPLHHGIMAPPLSWPTHLFGCRQLAIDWKAFWY